MHTHENLTDMALWHLPYQQTIGTKGQYSPAATGNRKPYVNPGILVCGIASWPMKPRAAIAKPAIMNGLRVCTRSDQKAKMIVIIAAKTYIGIVSSCALAAE